jgi:hypothetical protein
MNKLIMAIDGRITYKHGSMSGISLLNRQYDPTPANFAEEYRKAKNVHVENLSDLLSKKIGFVVPAECVEINYITLVRYWDEPL